MGRRTLLLITSILLAAVGTALIAVYVKGADSRAQKGQDLIAVQVVQSEVAAGTSVSDALRSNAFASGQRRRTDVVGQYVTDLGTISGQTVATTLLPGQVLQPAMFTKNYQSSTAAVGVTAGHVAASFQFTDPQRVAGTLEPGMLVTVYSVPQQGAVMPIEENVQVLKVGGQGSQSSANTTASSGTSADQVARTIVTFNLEDKQVRAMLKAQQAGGSLSLGVQPGPTSTGSAS